jgi:nitrate reductase gamma subunit
MHSLVYLLAYVGIIVCIASVVKKVLNYLSKPFHLRWELYPVPHEPGNKAGYGGSYMEDAEWWNKKREHSQFNMIQYMTEEILFMKACFEHNRSLWYRTYPFHLGLYFIVVFIALLVLGAIAELFKISLSPIIALTNLLGPAGLLLCMGGAGALIHIRLTDDSLKKYSTMVHFVNLILFIVVAFFGLIAWMVADPNFALTRGFIANMICFSFEPIGSTLLAIEIILVSLLIAYIPNTHMAHVFMKYFLYHDIRWGDNSAFDDPATVDKSLGVVLNYPVSWGASHINVANKKTWVEAATFNPAAEPETK